MASADVANSLYHTSSGIKTRELRLPKGNRDHDDEINFARLEKLGLFSKMGPLT